MKYAKERTATPKNADVQRVQLPNGKQAPLLVADLMEGIEMAVISQNVLAKLIELLPSASIYDIIAAHINKLKKMSEPTMEGYVQILKEELEFHESVNLIKDFILEKDAAEPEPASTTTVQAPEIYSE